MLNLCFYLIKNVMAKNPWIAHLSAYRKKHPGQSLKAAMKGAKASYTKVGSKKAPKAKGKAKKKVKK